MQVVQLTQLLRDARFADPPAECLRSAYSRSPLSLALLQFCMHVYFSLLSDLIIRFVPRASSPVGEYNLRLGIMKEMKPDYVATFQARRRRASGFGCVWVQVHATCDFSQDARSAGALERSLFPRESGGNFSHAPLCV